MHLQTYRKLRLSGAPAKHALLVARTIEAWEAANGWIFEGDGSKRRVSFPPDDSHGLVRLRFEPDDSGYDPGDLFTQAGNPGVSEARLKKQEKAFFERLDREGVWGIIAEYWDGERWQQADSCWGFDGTEVLNDPWTQSDFMQAALDALEKLEHCPTCGRPKA